MCYKTSFNVAPGTGILGHEAAFEFLRNSWPELVSRAVLGEVRPGEFVS